MFFCITSVSGYKDICFNFIVKDCFLLDTLVSSTHQTHTSYWIFANVFKTNFKLQLHNDRAVDVVISVMHYKCVQNALQKSSCESSLFTRYHRQARWGVSYRRQLGFHRHLGVRLSLSVSCFIFVSVPFSLSSSAFLCLSFTPCFSAKDHLTNQ